MPTLNFNLLFLTSLIPITLSFIYYHPVVMGKSWLITPEDSRMRIGPLRLVLFYVFGFCLSYMISLASIHQLTMFQLFFMEPDLAKEGTEIYNFVQDFLSRYGDRHRNFGHGVIHGAELTLLLGLGMLGISTIMERGSFKRMWGHLLFMVICGSLIGGILCAFA